MFGMGCFWGAEKVFWQLPGVHVTAAGYAGGRWRNPTYEGVAGGHTGHSQVVLVVYDQNIIPYKMLLKAFWENHDPTQGMRQGADIGRQYRSGIYACSVEQLAAGRASKTIFQDALFKYGLGWITTEIINAPKFHFAEDFHQQYFAKDPDKECGPVGVGLIYPAEQSGV